jgi:hypothetical protein
MLGPLTILAGFALCVVGLVLVVGWWTLIPAGVVLMAVGVFVDLDRVKEPQRGKRSQPAP